MALRGGLICALLVAGCGRIAFDPLASDGATPDTMQEAAWPTLDGQWTWMAGSNLADPVGVYGTRGVAAATNAPGGRDNGAFWFDDNKLWMFGGVGHGTTGYALLNDLWTYDRTSGLWTWLGGPTTGSDNGNAGTRGVPATTNLPGARNDPMTWMAPNHEVWVFGGTAPTGGTAIRNDMWRLDLETLIWTWFGGSQLINQGPVYGTRGVAAPTNDPGGRLAPVLWDDGTGDGFYAYGGAGIDTTNGPLGGMSDLWHFTASTLQWTWIAGPQTINNSSSRGTLGVASPTVLPGMFGACSIGDAKNGELLMVDTQADLWRFDLATSNWTWIGGPATDHATTVASPRRMPSAAATPGEVATVDCWSDQRGNLWMMGGYDGVDGMTAANALWLYQPTLNQWALIAGQVSSRQPGLYGTRGAPDAANAPSSRQNGMAWTTPEGELWLFGGDYGVDSTGASAISMGDLWRFSAPD